MIGVTIAVIALMNMIYVGWFGVATVDYFAGCFIAGILIWIVETINLPKKDAKQEKSE